MTYTYPSNDEGRLARHAVFNVILIYQDFDAGSRAKRVADYVAKEMGECEFAPTVWRTDLLGSPLLGEQVAEQAAKADIVILSLHDGHELSVSLRQWIDRWIFRQSCATPAVIALFAEPANRSSRVARGYLENVARRAGKDFLSENIAREEVSSVAEEVELLWMM